MSILLIYFILKGDVIVISDNIKSMKECNRVGSAIVSQIKHELNPVKFICLER